MEIIPWPPEDFGDYAFKLRVESLKKQFNSHYSYLNWESFDYPKDREANIKRISNFISETMKKLYDLHTDFEVRQIVDKKKK